MNGNGTHTRRLENGVNISKGWERKKRIGKVLELGEKRAEAIEDFVVLTEQKSVGEELLFFCSILRQVRWRRQDEKLYALLKISNDRTGQRTEWLQDKKNWKKCSEKCRNRFSFSSKSSRTWSGKRWTIDDQGLNWKIVQESFSRFHSLPEFFPSVRCSKDEEVLELDKRDGKFILRKK